MTTKIRIRATNKHFIEKNEGGRVLVAMRFCIQVSVEKGVWSYLIDDAGMYKYKTREERDAKMAKLIAIGI
jgi:hypothetical protein